MTHPSWLPTIDTEQNPLTEIAERVASNRYYRKNDEGQNIENWLDLSARVVDNVCKNEDDNFKRKAFDLVYHTKFLPNSPCLINTGNNVSGLLACFVTKSPGDSWIAMTDNIASFGHVARRGGGCGVDLSNIRPEGDPVFGSTHAKACGPIQHLRVLSEAMATITQAGFRGMANMCTFRIDHPDIMKFILCKQRNNALRSYLREDIFNHYEQIKEKVDEQLGVILDKFISNFNISIMTTDEFLEKVEKDEDIDLIFNGKTYQTLKAKDIFNAIVENAWKNGDPGMLFYSAINNGPYKYSKQEITATNPCGEQTLPSWGSCNLGSIDVSKFYDKDTNTIDWKELKKAIHVSFQFLDDVIDVNKFPTKDFSIWAKQNRPVGLGIMGWSDLLLKLKYTYGAPKSLVLAEELAEFFEKEAHKKSVALAKEKGTPKCCKYDELEHRRNVTTISIAPTGSISLLAGCSSSIEPIYSPIIYRYDNTGQYEFSHPDANKSHFRCALSKDGEKEVHWKEHIKMQAAFQLHCDSAISKTINMSNSATMKEVSEAYMLAWKSGCKGITVYRDGSKSTQVLNTDKKTGLGSNNAVKRAKRIPVDIHKTRADGMDWHIIVGKVDGCPYELFGVNGKVSLPDHGIVLKRKKRHYSLLDETGNELISNIIEEEKGIDPKISLETRRFSLELRHGIHPKYIVQQIDNSNEVVTSFSKAASRIMKKYLSAEDFRSIAEPCPVCAREGKTVEMISEAGCFKCPTCFYSKCG